MPGIYAWCGKITKFKNNKYGYLFKDYSELKHAHLGKIEMGTTKR